jgi:NitT/TauT family transport system ATP-binding protein
MPADPLIRFDHVHRRFGAVHAVDDVSLQVGGGEFVALLGPSGCGKSTLLRLAAGLEAPSSGHVHSPACQGAGPAETAFVFQEPTLMPWATVADNVWLPLRLAGVSRRQARPRVESVLQRVGLADFAQAYPAQLSGGMKMRASLARALITQPRVLLMDEPFAALDDLTRQALQVDLQRWWHGAGDMAALFVTHNVAEAVLLSQRVLVMSARPGRVAAELHIDAPMPRPADFRHGPAFSQACRELSAALVSAASICGQLSTAQPEPPR